MNIYKVVYLLRGGYKLHSEMVTASTAKNAEAAMKKMYPGHVVRRATLLGPA